MKRLFDDPIGKLDKVLDYLDNEEAYPEEFNTIRDKLNLTSKELHLILDKLRTDKLVEFNDVVNDKGEIQQQKTYHITFEGAILNSQNGYSQKILNQASDKIRLDKLESSHMEIQTSMVWLTVVLAFGSISLVIFEIYKFLFEHQILFVCP